MMNTNGKPALEGMKVMVSMSEVTREKSTKPLGMTMQNGRVTSVEKGG